MTQKKGKKVKQTVSLNQFLQETPEPKQSWADEPYNPRDNRPDWAEPVDDIKGVRSQLPSAPRSTREEPFDFTKVPHNPPFKAAISNLPFSMKSSDVMGMFRGLQIVKVNIAYGDDNRSRGYGTVEFTDRDNLIGAIQLNGTKIQGRDIKVSLDFHRESRQPRGYDDGYERVRDRDRNGYHRNESQETYDDDSWSRGDKFRDGDREDFGNSRSNRDYVSRYPPRDNYERESLPKSSGGYVPPFRRAGRRDDDYDAPRRTRGYEDDYRRGYDSSSRGYDSDRRSRDYYDSGRDYDDSRRGRYEEGRGYNTSYSESSRRVYESSRRQHYDSRQPDESLSQEVRDRLTIDKPKNDDSSSRNVSIFGEAKPVDTSHAYERYDNTPTERPRSYKPPGSRDTSTPVFKSIANKQSEEQEIVAQKEFVSQNANRFNVLATEDD